MATELLERIVIPYMNERGLKFNVDNDKINFPFTASGISLSVRIVDHELSDPVFEIIIIGIVRFNRKQEMTAFKLINSINRSAIGKFVLTNDLSVAYSLDTCTQNSSDPEAFKNAFEYAVATVVGRYPAIMRVRWANMPIEEAMQRQPFDRIVREQRGTVTENTPESPAYDELRELLERSFAEDEEGQEDEEEKKTKSKSRTTGLSAPRDELLSALSSIRPKP